MAAIPERARLELERRLAAHRKERWPVLKEARVRFHAPYTYVEAIMSHSYDQPLFRLRWTGRRDQKGGLRHLAGQHGGYENSVLPSGLLVGTVEEAMDCACGLYPNDISALGITPSTFRASSLAGRCQHRPSRLPDSGSDTPQPLPHRVHWDQKTRKPAKSGFVFWSHDSVTSATSGLLTSPRSA